MIHEAHNEALMSAGLDERPAVTATDISQPDAASTINQDALDFGVANMPDTVGERPSVGLQSVAIDTLRRAGRDAVAKSIAGVIEGFSSKIATPSQTEQTQPTEVEPVAYGTAVVKPEFNANGRLEPGATEVGQAITAVPAGSSLRLLEARDAGPQHGLQYRVQVVDTAGNVIPLRDAVTGAELTEVWISHTTINVLTDIPEPTPSTFGTEEPKTPEGPTLPDQPAFAPTPVTTVEGEGNNGEQEQPEHMAYPHLWGVEVANTPVQCNDVNIDIHWRLAGNQRGAEHVTTYGTESLPYINQACETIIGSLNTTILVDGSRLPVVSTNHAMRGGGIDPKLSEPLVGGASPGEIDFSRPVNVMLVTDESLAPGLSKWTYTNTNELSMAMYIDPFDSNQIYVHPGQLNLSWSEIDQKFYFTSRPANILFTTIEFFAKQKKENKGPVETIEDLASVRGGFWMQPGDTRYNSTFGIYGYDLAATAVPATAH